MKLFTNILLSSTLAFSLNVQDIVQKYDAIRNVSGSMYERGHIVEYKNARKVDSMTIDIYAKEYGSGFKTLVKILNPKKDKGKLILRSANKMWLYDPNSKVTKLDFSHIKQKSLPTAWFKKSYLPKFKGN